MYKIGLRSGATVSTGHMIEVGVHEAYMSLYPGQVVCIVEGYCQYDIGCPDAVVSEVHYNSEGVAQSVTCMLLTPDMLLEVPVFGTDIQIVALKVGDFIGSFQNSVSAAGTSEEYCQVMDTLGAKTAGDKILVRFINNNKATT